MKKVISLLSVFGLVMVFGSASVFAFQDKKPVKPKAGATKAKAKPTPPKKKDKPKFKKYEDVITKKAVTKKGVFTTHEVEGKLYYEFDPKDFGKEFLWLVQIAKVEAGKGLGGLEAKRHVVRFERLQDNILLRKASYRFRADEGSTEEISVKASSLEAIIASLKIVTFGPKKTPVVEMTSVFKGDIDDFSPKTSLNAAAIDRTKVFITSVKTFPKNIETRVLATYRARPPRNLPPQLRGRTSPGTVTAELHHSMVALPDKPMRPRYNDRRVGFFSGSYLDFSSRRNIAERVRPIRRWRLEKKNPGAAVSEPVKPIIWYVGRGVPKKYQQATIDGINMWQSAFEQAGFKNAIIGKLAPTKKEDPNWDAEDARYATIRWLASETRNAFGPHVQDPRSGEILEADVRMFHNVVALLEDWYFIQAGASDPRASKLPLSDKVMAELVRYVVAHEVGHSIGLQHNMLGNNAYPVESYRNQQFVEQFGMSSSIMDYARFNYIAQPGDNVAYIPARVGPYDRFAIEWGYKEFDNSKPVEADRAPLNSIAERQLTDPRLRFGSAGRGDPRAQTEDIGDDAIKATTYGMQNLERIAGNLVNATAENGKDFSRLSSAYGTLVNQMTRELGHVTGYLGGVEQDNLVSGISRSDAFRPTPVPKQREALAFIMKNAFNVQPFLTRRDIAQRIGMSTVVSRVSGSQRSIMRRVLSSAVVRRIGDMEAGGYPVYPAYDIFSATTKGIFSEAYLKNESPDVFRRNLQRATVDHLIAGLKPPRLPTGIPPQFIAQFRAQSSIDYRSLCRSMLVMLQSDLRKAAGRSKDNMARIHYADLADSIGLALSGK
ncbi:MAG: zinc-dependent metalloprotease [Pyrinomonadaceae bacterium]|nr:zinc-dependent metalloprotease [Pyrinomonadaceae bacterium]